MDVTIVYAWQTDRPDLRPERHAVVLLHERRPFLCRDIAKLRHRTSKGGNPQEIGPKIRKEQEDRIEAFLTDAQKKQWKEMLGKPLDLGD